MTTNNLNNGQIDSKSLIILSHFTVQLLVELHKHKFLESDYFKNMNFSDKFVQQHLPKYGIDNQGTLVMMLYAMLVLPKELWGTVNNENDSVNNKNDNENDYFVNGKLNKKRVNKELLNIVSKENIQCDNNYYPDDLLTHIRNAVAHGRVRITPNESIHFIDENNNLKNKKSCTITISLKDIGKVFEILHNVFAEYIKYLKNEKNPIV
jgi:hypothetical protein